MGQRKILSPHEESSLRPSDSALWCSNTEPQRLYGEVYYEVYMTRVLYTARIRNFDSVMFLNRVREMVSIELGKEMLSMFFSPRKSSSCECHSNGYAGYFLELPGGYQSSRELKIQFHAGGVIWSLGRRQERTARVTWIPQISFFQFMKSAKKGSQSFPPSELRRPRCIERWKLLCSKKKIRTCCLSCHFTKVPRRRRRTTHDTVSSVQSEPNRIKRTQRP